MEAYGAAASGQALRFLSAWTRELHALGYLSGVYSSSSSGVADLAREYHSTRLTHPDVIYDALWNGAKNVTDSSYRNGAWSGRRRVHQFSGNVLQTFGGDTMDVDQDYLDLALTAPGGTTESAAGTIEAGAATTVFYRGSGNHLWAENRAAGGSWSRRDLGGQLSSEPSVVRVGKSGLAVFYRNGTGELTVIRRSAGRWLAPQVLARMGIIGGAPRAVAQTNGVIDVFWSGNYDKHLWHGEFNPGRGWSGPQALQGSLASWPDPVESGTGVVQVFWEGTDGRLWRVVRRGRSGLDGTPGSRHGADGRAAARCPAAEWRDRRVLARADSALDLVRPDRSGPARSRSAQSRRRGQRSALAGRGGRGGERGLPGPARPALAGAADSWQMG